MQEILTKNQKVFKTVRAESEQIRTEYQNDLAGMVFCADCGRSMDFDRLPHGAEESKRFVTIFAEQGRRMISASDTRLRKSC